MHIRVNINYFVTIDKYWDQWMCTWRVPLSLIIHSRWPCLLLLLLLLCVCLKNAIRPIYCCLLEVTASLQWLSRWSHVVTHHRQCHRHKMYEMMHVDVNDYETNGHDFTGVTLAFGAHKTGTELGENTCCWLHHLHNCPLMFHQTNGRSICVKYCNCRCKCNQSTVLISQGKRCMSCSVWLNFIKSSHHQWHIEGVIATFQFTVWYRLTCSICCRLIVSVVTYVFI